MLGATRGDQRRPKATKGRTGFFPWSPAVALCRPVSPLVALCGVVAMGLVACGGAAAEHERLGDKAYAERRFGDALVEYRLALVSRMPDPALRAKAGAAALHVGDLTAAAEEYVALAQEGGEQRVDEAADGLVRVANVALAQRNQEALAAALTGLQRVAPRRAVGSFALQLVRTTRSVPRSGEGLTLLSYAAAGAPDARTQDSLMFAYGRLLRRLGRCQSAVPVFESLGRRQREPAIVRDAQEGVALCALVLGRRALDRGQPSDAEEWFRRAAQGGGDTAPARTAYIGLGDVQFAQGAYLAAARAYERARAGLSQGDSLYAIASERLNMLGQMR